ncbi:MAG TPA: dUTP diphosphatase [Burkholderiaceae bacterium]|nr:dUTP diphosphatase [Burkholderiaceae bacterium]
MSDTPRIELKVLDPRLHQWGLPRYQTSLAAGIDLIACLDARVVVAPQAPAILVPTGLAMHMNATGYCALILPRSGLGHKRGLVLGNGTGVIDADYTQQCFVSVWNRNPAGDGDGIAIEPGDRIAQMVFVPIVRPRFDIVDEFNSPSARVGGFGSTGLSGSASGS